MVSKKVHFVECIRMEMILSPKLKLQNLKDRSLIKWVEDGNLYMHEQLQDTG
jgi:hypothetical protein